MSDKKPSYMMAKEAREESREPSPPIPKKQETSDWELQNLHSRHHQICRLLVARPDLTQKEIAKKLGVTSQTVSNVKNSQIGQRRINLLQKRVDDVFMDQMDYIEDLSHDALALLEDFMLDPGKEDKLRKQIAQDILDRAGKREAKKFQHQHAHLTAQDIEEMKERAALSGNQVKEE